MSESKLNEESSLQKIHILPIEKNYDRVSGIIGETLRSLRDKKERLYTGYNFSVDDKKFCVVATEPQAGYLSKETRFFVDGHCILAFSKVQLAALEERNPREEIEPEAFFQNYIKPYFEKEADNEFNGETKMTTFFTNDILDIQDRRFLVQSVEFICPLENPSVGVSLGHVTRDTEIFVSLDTNPVFNKLHVVPFHDTLPRAYQYDVFSDYIQPFFKKNSYKTFRESLAFTFQSVQFKIICTDPANVLGRVTRDTEIFCDGILHPQVQDFLSPEVLTQLSNFPPGIQMILLNSDTFANENLYERLVGLQDSRNSVPEEVLARIECVTWSEEEQKKVNQVQCMICLSNFEMDEHVRILPCRHVFHRNCVQEWFSRSTECPICKTDVTQSRS